MSKPKVYLTGGDGWGWALDECLHRTRETLDSVVEFTSLLRCDVIHSIWPADILCIPRWRRIGKKIICDLPSAPWRFFEEPEKIKKYGKIFDIADLFIMHNDKDVEWLRQKGFRVYYIPYAADTQTFHPLQYTVVLDKWQETWNIPKGKYLIGNFHRDTEGADLTKPKLVKGPDIFVEIVHALHKQGLPIHVILAGPRRHWIRRELKRREVPYTFVGKAIEGEDIEENLLPRTELNLLYNLIDLYLITSREEGGPLTLLEAAAAKCKVLSTNIGMVSEVLDPLCIYKDSREAADIIRRDIQNGWMSVCIERHYDKVMHRHTPQSHVPCYKELYSDLLVEKGEKD